MQHTLKQPFTLRSKGLHTGLELTATFLPAPVNSGLSLQRVDLDGQPIIPCLAENVVDTSRGTVVAISPEVRVSTIEHAMAALYASGIDNCLVQLDGPEMPILDGSSRYFMQFIQQVGVEAQDEVLAGDGLSVRLAGKDFPFDLGGRKSFAASVPWRETTITPTAPKTSK